MSEPRRHVRRATPDDAPAIARCLAVLGYDTTPSLVADKMRDVAESAADAVLVAVSASGDVEGVVSVHVLPLFHAPGNLARLTALAVRPEAQHVGVGRALVAAAEAIAWAAGCRRVEVTSGDHRPVAHAFYVRAGYAPDERRFVKHAPDASPPR